MQLISVRYICTAEEIRGKLVCKCDLPDSFQGMGAFYCRRGILNTILLLTRITAH